MDEPIKVSIALCTYNGAKYLKEQLDSIVAQTYPIYECIIVDDCSTDETMNIVQDYSQKYFNWHIYQNEKNIGYNKNFEKALQLTTGGVIAICDQDDIWHKDKIKIMLELWNNNSLLAHCHSIQFQNDIPKNPTISKIFTSFRGTDARKIFVVNTVSGHNVMIKRALLHYALPFNHTGYYDWWLAVVAAYNGGVTSISKILTYQRFHYDRVTVEKEGSGKYSSRMKIDVKQNLSIFLNYEYMPVQHKLFGEKLLRLWGEALNKKIYLPLFFFLIYHRRIVFYSKKRKLGLLSHIKNSFLLAYNKIIIQ